MTQLDPKFGPWGPDPTHLGLNLDGSPARLEIRFKSGSFGFKFITYIIGFNYDLNLFRGQLDPIRSVF